MNKVLIRLLVKAKSRSFGWYCNVVQGDQNESLILYRTFTCEAFRRLWGIMGQIFSMYIQSLHVEMHPIHDLPASFQATTTGQMLQELLRPFNILDAGLLETLNSDFLLQHPLFIQVPNCSLYGGVDICLFCFLFLQL